ncbi:MAG TPA: tetratricopeptide repeat protein [Longimicrobium sp.]
MMGIPYGLPGLVHLALVVFFAVHAVRTGRFFWIFILLFFPFLGALVYFFAEYLPEMRRGRGMQAVTRTVARAINPGAEVRRLEDELRLADTHDRRVELARAYREAGRLDDAIRMLDESLAGMYADEPKALWELTRACFAAGRMDEARGALERLRRARTLSADQQLMGARIHEEAGDVPAALREYEAAAAAATGEEARCRYALLLKRAGRADEARQLFDRIVLHARMSPAYFRKSEKEWIEIARRELKAGEAVSR